MARRLTWGAEWADVFEAGLGVNGPDTITTTSTGANVRTGGWAMQWSAVSGGGINSEQLFGGSTNTRYFLRAYMKIAANATGGTIMRFSTTGAVALGSIRLSSSSTPAFQLWNDVGAAQVGANQASVDRNVWHRVELAVRVPAGGGVNSTVYMSIDGTELQSGLLNLGTTAPGLAEVGAVTSPGAVSTIYGDDFALNDDSGASQNAYPGAGNVVLLRPASDNARTGYVTGAAGISSLFAGVDNQPPTGAAAGTATNRIHSPTNNATDTYDANLTTYTTAGIPDGATINAVHLIANVGGASTTADNQALQMISNPVIAEGASIGKPTAAWGTYPSNWVWGFSDVLAYAPSPTFGVAPVMRIRRATANASQLGADAMGAYVDYTPAATSSPVPQPVVGSYMRT